LLCSNIGPTPEFGFLEVTVLGQDESAPIPCRAWVEASGAHYFRPETPAIVYDKDKSFSCNGTFCIRIPAGKATVHIERGKEFLPIDQTVIIKANQTIQKSFFLKRWIAMHEEGWFSSDMHVHFGSDDIDILKQLSSADDVNLLPAFTYWYHKLDNMKKQWPQ